MWFPTHLRKLSIYRAITNATCEITWLSYLLNDIGLPLSAPTPLYCDNQFALHIVSNLVYHECTKHIKIDCHVVREKIASDLSKTIKVNSTNQITDLFTKSLGRDRFMLLRTKMGVSNLHTILRGVLRDINLTHL